MWIPRALKAALAAGAIILGSNVGTSHCAGNRQMLEQAETLERKLIPNTSGAWTVKRDWSAGEMEIYSRWFTNIYDKKSSGTPRQRAAKLARILQDPDMNLLLRCEDCNDRSIFDSKVISTMDRANACGTFPILMHMYYCAMRGLPATFSKVSGHGGDIRYSRGNRPTRILDPISSGKSLREFIRDVFFGELNYTTGNWRTAPDLEGTDTVPIAARIDHIRPGFTLLYNPDGHGLAIARLSDAGRVGILDGHPDGSITSGQTLAALESVTQSIPERNRLAWYSGVRMIRLARCVSDSQGRIIGIRPCTNREMERFGFSDEQYKDIISIRKGLPVTIDGTQMTFEGFPGYLQRKLSKDKRADAHALLREWTDQLQAIFEERETFVQQAWQDVLQNGPITLPDNRNIYQAEGRWERWSSPSSDCDRKGAYFMMVDEIEQALKEHDARPETAGSGGQTISRQDLAYSILDEKKRLFESRTVTYTNSRGEKVALKLSDIEKRIFMMSFDPNHPPEIRWGAAPGTEEAQGCREIATPLASGGALPFPRSYDKEQGLRYRLTRKAGLTPLDGSDNPKGPLKTLLDERLARYIQR